MNNFKDVAQSLIKVGAARFVDDSDTLNQAILELAKDAKAREEMQKAGLNWHVLNRGSSERIAESILKEI